MTIDLPSNVLTVLRALDESGIFTLKNGSATLHFDSDGTLSTIETNIIAYRRQKVVHTPTFTKVNVVY